jgi:microcystin degradation protein MlrC
LSIGTSRGDPAGAPLGVNAEVVRLYLDGPRRSAVVRVGGVEIVLCADRREFTSYAELRRVGVEPDACRVVVVKLGYLFPDLRDRAPRAVLALTPGLTSLRVDTLPYRNIVRPVYPIDADVRWPS